MSTKKVIGGSVAAIVILIIAQLAAQLAASALTLIKIPDGICNIIAGIFYVGLTYVILKITSFYQQWQQNSNQNPFSFNMKYGHSKIRNR